MTGAALRQPEAAVWDCHVHLFEPAFAFAPVRAYTPEPATPADLQEHLRRVGASHAVLVQATAHGSDNAALLDALDRLGPRFRAVIAPAPDLDARALAGLRRRGVRGLRLNPMGGIVAVDDAMRGEVRRVARLAAEAGVTLELHATATALDELSDELDGCPGELVVAHLAGLAAPEAGAETLHRVADLLERRRIWVKLSGLDRYEAGPALDAVSRLAAAVPDRLVWGSDWPHTPFHDGSAVTDDLPWPARQVDDADLKAAIAATLGAEAGARAFSRNPALLYG